MIVHMIKYNADCGINTAVMHTPVPSYCSCVEKEVRAAGGKGDV